MADKKAKPAPKKAAAPAKAAPAKKAPAPAKKAPAEAAKPLTKAQVTDYFAKKFELTKVRTGEILDELVKLATEEAKRCGSFTLPGLGKLTLAERKARTGRNPATGETIQIPAKTVAKMRLSKTFVDAIVPQKATKKK